MPTPTETKESLTAPAPNGDAPPHDIEITPPAGSFDIFSKALGETKETVTAKPEVKTSTEEGLNSNTEVIEGEETQPATKPEVTEPEVKDPEVTPTEKEVIVEAPANGKPKDKVDPRDYSIFNQADVPALKQMSNKAFDVHKKLFLELKELKAKPPENKTGLPDSYYENPRAFMLSPEYDKLVTNVTFADQVATHWKKQEINIRKTGKFEDMTQDAQGNIVIHEPKDATVDDEIRVNKYADWSRDQHNKLQSQLEDTTKNFKKRHEDDVGVIQKAEAQYFPDYDKTDHPTQPLQKAIIEALPASFRSNPVTKLLAKTGAANALYINRIKTLEAELAKLKGIKTDSNGAPPTRKSFVPGKPKETAGTFDIFDKQRLGLI